MESSPDLKNDRYYASTLPLSHLRKEMSGSFAESSEDEVFFGPITPKEMKNDAILRGLRRTQHFIPGSRAMNESQKCHSPRNPTAIQSPFMAFEQNIPERFENVNEAPLASVHDTLSETRYRDSLSSLQDSITKLTFLIDNDSSTSIVQDEVSIISESILLEPNILQNEKQFGRELQNKLDSSPAVITKTKIATPRMSQDSLDVVDDDKENSSCEGNMVVFRSSLHIPLQEIRNEYENCAANEQCEEILDTSRDIGLVPPTSPVEDPNLQNPCGVVEFAQKAYSEITPSFEHVPIQTAECEQRALRDVTKSEVEMPEIICEEDIGVYGIFEKENVNEDEDDESDKQSFYSTVSNVDQLFQNQRQLPEAVVSKVQQKIERQCAIVDVVERKCQLTKTVSKPASPRCSPNIAKLAIPKRVTPKKQMTPRTTQKPFLANTQSPSSKKTAIVAKSFVAKYIKNNDVVTPQIKQIKANDGRSASKIQKRFPSKIPVSKSKVADKTRESNRITAVVHDKDETTEESVLEEMKILWDKYDETFEKNAKDLIMDQINALKGKFVQLANKRESILPVAECSYVLPEGSYTVSGALALEEKNWDVVTKMHTQQNMQSKRGFPAPPLQPTIFKHTGCRKRIKWVPGLATAAMKKCSPTNVQSVAPPILLSRNAERHNPAFMDASSLEASVVFQIPPS